MIIAFNRKQYKWLTKREEISTADIGSLKRSLITCDGMGEKFKTEVLEELISRISKGQYEKNY